MDGDGAVIGDCPVNDEYELVVVTPGSDDWMAFHHVQRTALFRQSPAEYEPTFHDAYYFRPARRCQLLLKWNRLALGVTTLDEFQDSRAATRSVAVAEEFQGKGHGRTLLLLTQEFAKRRGIETLCVNAGADAVGFYRSLGFVEETWDATEFDGIESPQTMVQMTRCLV